MCQIAGIETRRKADKLGDDVNLKQALPGTPSIQRPVLGFPVQVNFVVADELELDF